jgi:hypothetical protein
MFRFKTVLALILSTVALSVSLGVSAQNVLSTNEQAKTNPALADARQRLFFIDGQVRDAEQKLRFLHPPMTRTDAKGITTVDQLAQRKYEQDRSSFERNLKSLRQERMSWQMQVNQLINMEAMMAQQRAQVAAQAVQAAPAPVAAPAPSPIVIVVPATPAVTAPVATSPAIALTPANGVGSNPQ